MSTNPQSNPFVLLNVAVDAISAGTIVGALAGLLPPLAAVAAIIWYAIQIYESKTFRVHLRLRRMKARARRLAHKAVIAYTSPSST